MKLYKDKHYGKLTKEQNLSLKSLSKSLIGGALLGLSFAFVPTVSGDSLITLGYSELTEEIYIDTINDYNKIIDNIVTLIKKLNIDNPDDIFYIVSLLIQSGQLSIDQKFSYNEDKPWDIKGYYGIDVIKGTGVCRHEAALLNDVLNKCGYESSVVINDYFKEYEQLVYHAVVFLENNDSYKIYDPTNLCTGVSNENLEIFLTNGDKITLKPFLTYINGYIDINKAIKIYNTKNLNIASSYKINEIDKNYLVKEVSNLRQKNELYIENICFREGYYGWNNSSKQKIKSYK